MLKNLEDKKKIELLITGIGIIILFFLITNGIFRPKFTKAVSKTGSFLVSEPGPPSFTNNDLATVSSEQWKRDPFLLDTSNVEEYVSEDLALNGIAADKENPYAVINNNVVKLGDKVRGMTVIEINEKNVVLDENGKTHTLELDVY